MLLAIVFGNCPLHPFACVFGKCHRQLLSPRAVGNCPWKLRVANAPGKRSSQFFLGSARRNGSRRILAEIALESCLGCYLLTFNLTCNIKPSGSFNLKQLGPRLVCTSTSQHVWSATSCPQACPTTSCQHACVASACQHAQPAMPTTSCQHANPTICCQRRMGGILR